MIFVKWGLSLPVQYCQHRPNNTTLIVLCLSSQEPLRGRSISWASLTYLLSTTPRRKQLMQQKLSSTGWVAQERKERGSRPLLSCWKHSGVPAQRSHVCSHVTSWSVRCNTEDVDGLFIFVVLCLHLLSLCYRLVLKSPQSTPSSMPNDFGTSSQTFLRNTQLWTLP